MPNKDDRVVCINDDWSGHRAHIPAGQKLPVKNQVYYISEIAEFLCGTCIEVHVFYFIVGLGREVCFDARRFRPVIDDEQRTETTVQELLRNATPVKIKTPEKVS